MEGRPQHLAVLGAAAAELAPVFVVSGANGDSFIGKVPACFHGPAVQDVKDVVFAHTKVDGMPKTPYRLRCKIPACGCIGNCLGNSFPDPLI